MKKEKEIWLFSPKFLCHKVNKSLIFYFPIVVLHLLNRRPLSSWLPSFVFSATIASFPLYFMSYLSFFISFHGTRLDPDRSRPTTTSATNSKIGSSWVKLKVIGVKCAFNATIQSHINDTNDNWDSTFSRSESEVFLFLDFINTCNWNFFHEEKQVEVTLKRKTRWRWREFS